MLTDAERSRLEVLARTAVDHAVSLTNRFGGADEYLADNDAIRAALAVDDELRRTRQLLRPFPMQYGPAIPWYLAEIIYAGYSAVEGTQQTLARMAERGGFGWAEVTYYWKNESRAKAAMEAAARAALGDEK